MFSGQNFKIVVVWILELMVQANTVTLFVTVKRESKTIQQKDKVIVIFNHISISNETNGALLQTVQL